MEDEVRAGDLRRGFPLVRERDAQALEAERAFLREVDGRASVFGRWKGYWKLTGPGWLQSAITLGAGSAGSTILAGAAFGYKLLWVNPLAMFLGVVVFAAIGRQALLTQARPYNVFRPARPSSPAPPSATSCFGSTPWPCSWVSWFLPQSAGRLSSPTPVPTTSSGNGSIPPWSSDSSLNLVMIPAAYLGFFLLHNSKSCLGSDVMRGPRAALWNALLILAILVVAAGAIVKIFSFF